MIFELIGIKYCMQELQKRKKENFTRDDTTEKTEETNESSTMIILLVVLLISFILAIWGIVDAVKNCKEEDRVVGVLLAIFVWPLYWILRLTGAFCRKN